jgi:hypothetical protein
MKDPLDTNVNDIDISFPVLPEKILDLRCVKAERVVKEDGTGETIKLEFETTTSEMSKRGDPIPAGSMKLFRYIGITEKPERVENGKTKKPWTPSDIAKSVAQVAKPAGLNCSARAFIDNPAVLEGRVVRAKIIIEKAEGRYPERNSIGEFVTIK